MLRKLTRTICRVAAGALRPFEGDEGRRRRQANHYASQLLAELKRAGLYRKIDLGRGEKRIERVRFEYPLLMTRDELWCPIDIRRLPTGLVTDDLRREEIIHSLEDRLDTAVWLDKLANGKICYVVRLGGAAFPERFPINAFKMPDDAPPLAFPLGVDRRGDQQWADLARLPHLLVVGPTGKGKSTFVHAMLTTWISRNDPEDLELWLADHKGGAELNRYHQLTSSRGRPGIVRRFSYKPEDTIELLDAAQRECERRLERMRKVDASDLDDYARQTGERMRRIAIVIDEIFFLMLNREKIDKFTIAQWAEHLFAKIASAGRAPGIHLVIATQKTGKDVLTSLITANFETRAVFGLADMYQSIYLLGNAKAVGLPRGRIFFAHEGVQRELQSPLITAEQTRLTISRISRYGPNGGLGEAAELRRLVDDAKLLITLSSERLGGKFDRRSLLQLDGVKGVISEQRVRDVAGELLRRGVIVAGGRGRNQAARIAPAFVNRADLLDVLFGVEGRTPIHPNSTPNANPGQFGVDDLAHQDAVPQLGDLDLGCADQGTFPGDPAPELPESLRGFLDTLPPLRDEPPES